MTNDTQQQVAALAQAIRHHAGIAGKKYELRERIFHARKLKEKADDLLDILVGRNHGKGHP